MVTYRQDIADAGIGDWVSVCPSTAGGHNWHAMAYSPGAGALVIPLSQSCLEIAGREVALEVGSGGSQPDRRWFEMPGTGGNLGKLAAYDVVLVQLCLRHGRQQSGPQLVVGDVGIEQHGAEPAVALNDPVDGVALRLEHAVEAFVDQFPIAVEELAVHVDGLVERVAPRLVQEAHQREVTAWGRHPAHPVG